jgi:hypothetical protein
MGGKGIFTFTRAHRSNSAPWRALAAMMMRAMLRHEITARSAMQVTELQMH